MKKFLSITITVFFSVALWGQSQQQNLTKYWRYRERLRQNFVLVSENVEEFGTNIPAVEKMAWKGVSWGDGNSNMSHYLSLLTTELYLLKKNDQSYAETLKELYYAMLAMERLDLYSEYKLRVYHNKAQYIDPATDFNGFYIRDDPDADFWENHKDHFTKDFQTDKIRSFQTVPDSDPTKMQGLSQDNIYHMMEAFSLMASLLGIENVQYVPVTFKTSYIPDYLGQKGIKSGNYINFSKWAKDFMKRQILLLQHSSQRKMTTGMWTHWYLENPVTGELVREGSGEDLDLGSFYHDAIIRIGNKIVGENLRKHNGYLQDPDLFKELFKDGCAINLNTVAQSTAGVELLYGAVDGVLSIFGGGIPESGFSVSLCDGDDYKTRCLGALGNELNESTLKYLIKHRNNNHTYPYEHFPLINLAVHDKAGELLNRTDGRYLVAGVFDENGFVTEKNYYESLLNSAPECGPTNEYVSNWSSTSRCVWPENLDNIDQNALFSGMDYMMLHNLYYLIFCRHDYKELQIPVTLNTTYNSKSMHGAIVIYDKSVTATNFTLNATNRIILNQGFVADKNNFIAQIAPFSSPPFLYKGVDYRIKGVEQCNNPVLQSGSEAQPLNKEAGKENDFQYDHETKLFPNPTGGKLTISGIQGECSVKVFNTAGICVSSYLGEGDLNIDIGDQAEGVYFITITTDSKTVSKQIFLYH